MEKTFNITAELNEIKSNHPQVSLKTDRFEWTCQVFEKESLSFEAPSPEELMLSALVASTLLDLDLFLKLNDLFNIKIRVEGSLEINIHENIINQILIIDGGSEEEREKILDIAQQSSIHSLLGNDLEIITSISSTS